jgi:hypothetical protein
MPSDDEIIIRNGTLRQWLTYEIVFGAKPVEAYEGSTQGGTRVKAYWIVGGLLLALIVAIAV